MPEILIVVGHPDSSRSNANARIARSVQAHFGSRAEVRFLDRLKGADGHFDIAAEQAALAQARLVVWQVPMYWYNAPALMRQWLEEVLTHGFAYGSKGKALHGKPLILSITTGGSEQDFCESGAESFPLEAFLPPFTATANLCGMQWQPPIASFAHNYMEGSSTADDLARVHNEADNHARRLIAQLETLLPDAA